MTLTPITVLASHPGAGEKGVCHSQQIKSGRKEGIVAAVAGIILFQNTSLPLPTSASIFSLFGETEQGYLDSEFWRTSNLWYVSPHQSTSKFTFWFYWRGQGAERFLLAVRALFEPLLVTTIW